MACLEGNFQRIRTFGKITGEQVTRVESMNNNRPRKCLSYKTSLEVNFHLYCTSTLNVGRQKTTVENGFNTCNFINTHSP